MIAQQVTDFKLNEDSGLSKVNGDSDIEYEDTWRDVNKPDSSGEDCEDDNTFTIYIPFTSP